MKKRVYIAGPMRGYEQMNRAAFYEAHSKLEQDYEVVNPHELDMAESFPEWTSNDLSTRRFQMSRMLLRDLMALQTCDFIYLLPGWEESLGARVELCFARFLGITVMGELQ